MGFRLNDNGKFDAINYLPHGGIHSEVLGIEFRIQGDEIGLLGAASGEWLQTPEEKVSAIAQQEILARQNAEAEVARLRTEIEKLKTIQEKHEN